MPQSTTQSTSIQKLLSRLCAALNSDCQIRASNTHEEGLSDVLNAALVLIGVRPGARLDLTSYARSKGRCTAWSRSALKRAIAREARRLGVRLAWIDSYEPLVINLDAVSDEDVRTIRALYVPGMSDLREPLVGAMGRVLGYGCPYVPLTNRTAGVSLEARLYCADTGRPQSSLWLAGFQCSRRSAADARIAAVRHWLAPACAALGGCALDYFGRRYVVAGFELT